MSSTLASFGRAVVVAAISVRARRGDAKATDSALRDGWFVTGDIGHFDDEGFLSIEGRLSRFSKIGGEMVPLEKVEDEIQEILGSTEKLCAVTAIPDQGKGERLIVLHLPLAGITVPDVRKRLTERGLPNIYVPGQRDFYEVAELPILGTGKLDLKKCKELAMQRAGDAAA